MARNDKRVKITLECTECKHRNYITMKSKINDRERLDRLGRGLDDVEEALVDAHLEVLAGVLVDVRATDDRVPVLVGGQRDGTAHRGVGTGDRLDDLARRLVDDLVIECLEADANALCHEVCQLTS